MCQHAYLCSRDTNLAKSLASPLTNLYACQIIEDITVKNECYNRAANALRIAEKIAEKQGEIVILDDAALREIREGVFGYKYTPFSKPGLEYVARTSPLETITVPVNKLNDIYPVMSLRWITI